MFSVVMIRRMENTWGLRRSTTEPTEGSQSTSEFDLQHVYCNLTQTIESNFEPMNLTFCPDLPSRPNRDSILQFRCNRKSTC